ncbi:MULTISPECIES: response regulator transcription factor [Yersinia]|uniref:response regulator transcription factor n=1 Tax=Yersinia TaxID=629 RepID=UPI0005E48704|nr:MULTISPECIES: response regulator transcription factor [Yersinia]OVZ97631.1 DNA-binding response regulator [Yersinia frederiksenii]RXA96434.1 response regulator transcription factor [Yersinia sp. 2105 StPb PI]CNI70239.1 putative two-component response regulator [Yersinia frederiksenii]CNJ07674.1 putative two-component response regulator [Yersinia frederiksenii]CNK59357.1 putative two-component response regulator [Yersinia frederiksenii]
MKILIAEDNAHIRNGLMEVLAHEGYHPIAAENGVQALALYRQQQPDFIILDIMMPELDGYKVCREIRKHNWQIPIVFLSAKDEEIDRVIGLELGADDYISKPFGIHEMRARIKTIARRCLRQAPLSEEDAGFPFGDLTVIPTELCATRGEQRLELSLREVNILRYLYQHKNRVVTRDMLFDAVWGYDHLPQSRTLDQHISKLRKTIELDPVNPVLIRTVHGIGYRYQGGECNHPKHSQHQTPA